MGIHTVLFDYSGVLTTSLTVPDGDLGFDRDALFVEMAAALAGPDPHPWHELERGEIPLGVFVDYVETRVPGAGVMFGADSSLNVMKNLELRPERLAAAQLAKAGGLRVGLVTNNVAEWRTHWLPRLPADLFEVIIDSAEIGYRKPDAEIYGTALEQMGIAEPDEVLFVDDFEWNVAGAVDAGLQGLHCPEDLDLGRALENCADT